MKTPKRLTSARRFTARTLFACSAMATVTLTVAETWAPYVAVKEKISLTMPEGVKPTESTYNVSGLVVQARLYGARSTKSFCSLSVYRFPKGVDPNLVTEFSAYLAQGFASKVQSPVLEEHQQVLDGMLGQFKSLDVGDQRIGLWIAKINGNIVALSLRTDLKNFDQALQKVFRSFTILD